MSPFLQADALYFQARENGTSYAIVDDTTKYPDFQSHFGAKLKLGCEGENGWQVWLDLLHYHARNHSSVSGEVIPTWGHPGSGLPDVVEKASSMWRLHMGFVDLDLGRMWVPSFCLDLTPYFGLRFASVRHKSDLDYVSFSTFSMKNKFWGIGPQTGVDGLLKLGRHVGIFSHLAGSFLFGEIYVHQTQSLSDGKIKFFRIFDQIRAIFEMGLGLDFRTCVQSTEFFFKIGFETYLLFGQNQHVRFTSNEMPGKYFSNQGDLSLHGLTLALGASF